MRLTVFGPSFPFRGGIARATTDLVGALMDRGHEVLFLTARRQYPHWLYPGVSDRDPDACRKIEGALSVLDPLDPTIWRRARHLAEEHRSDAWIVSYWTWVWSGLWRAMLRGRDRPPAIAVVHNPVDHDAGRWQRLVSRAVLGRCQGLFTHAEVLARELMQMYPSVPVGYHCLPASAALVLPERRLARVELDLPEERRVALFLGLIRPYKGVDVLVEAAAGLAPDSDWFVVVAGEPWGGLGGRLRREVATRGLDRRMRLDLGWIPEERMPLYLAAADVLVLPYLRGSQSAVAPLALASGLPVVTTAVGGVPEIVVDGENGLVVPAGDPGAITAALESLSRERLTALAAGAGRSAERLSWDGYAAALESLIGRTIRERIEKRPRRSARA